MNNPNSLWAFSKGASEEGRAKYVYGVDCINQGNVRTMALRPYILT